MKHSIWKSLRLKLVLYGAASLLLAGVTESILAMLLYLMSTVLGVSRQDTVYQADVSYGQDAAQMPSTVLKHLEQLGSDSLYTMIAVGILAGVFLFVAYFLFLTRGLTRDLSNLAAGISSMTMERPRRLPVKRQDEIGEIARSVNEMTEELTRLMDAEREALQTNKEMIACLAHDLRTPLTSLNGYLNLMMDTDKYDAAQRQHFTEVALRKADRLEGLIQDLFDYTKLMSGEITLHRKQVDFVKLIEQMVEEFYPLMEDNELHCCFDSAWKSLELAVDPDLMARAVQNLLSNAVKYGKDGKQIRICLQERDGIVLSVTNYGLIIPEESLDMIFERFYRVEGARSPQTGGTGLGLNIAREIIVLHGGSITAQSSLQGTIFEIFLPWQNETEDAEF